MRNKLQIFRDIEIERDRQDAKWGDQSDTWDPRWLAVLTEEVGEVAKEILEGSRYNTGYMIDTEHLREELVQCAAVTIAWIEAIDTRVV